MFKRFKSYRRKRELAHKILAELAPQKDAELYKKAGAHYFITDNQGRTLFHSEQLGLIKIERCYVDFRSLKILLKKYSESDIEQALQLLVGNDHIEIEDKLKPTSPEMVAFAISPKGRLAFDEMTYLSSKFADVHPVIDKFRTGAITALFSLTVGIILWSLANQKQVRENNLQNKRLNNLSDSLKMLQMRTDNLSKHR